MNPFLPNSLIQPNPSLSQNNGSILYPGIFSVEDSDYLSSLDSDTRDYVLKHTDDNRTMADIKNCIDKLQSKS